MSGVKKNKRPPVGAGGRSRGGGEILPENRDSARLGKSEEQEQIRADKS